METKTKEWEKWKVLLVSNVRSMQCRCERDYYVTIHSERRFSFSAVQPLQAKAGFVQTFLQRVPKPQFTLLERSSCKVLSQFWDRTLY